MHLRKSLGLWVSGSLGLWVSGSRGLGVSGSRGLGASLPFPRTSGLRLDLPWESQRELGACVRADDEHFATVHVHDQLDHREAQPA